ncbi:30S ribosomal protein S3 [Candidatus Woesebacteria bacterium RIFCSPHIGHO2_02_FULL_42_20]|uniref:Small ribosomal subunit protein uS3 n=1 Tax=Candidatus Woesebacteria bacterium RIFCSPHIGHO2_12_FULL_41_24 TaxID=1802510 RepID=A0A1F8API4_9BACT|nr:MAG: 30S ribosomal protein S3 [Candidatus Woesebacteria bacterium RBG_16_41_13]OGM29241.1 MAG: 30S ribosomal protein S3 [Candidatus Woesebacteria bacterium RIFCSPHIGHO2_01_FULL_42_80]OGM34739.1 MAG: 30S ribosomal protein S3 [Candidatus Woesebacteria bacterium RIFCSPHIGHO2_02_FULL_42_20]OGM53672.1 MAG: 30S ribosomal protein S3 [Candidatus Woesebacteria bacterium RIFCSPHIGHO2_12_FULL_41_24]OGM67038.1 MAG: 30S ribosomal protein S3 [Candidatus Woesebacteria bacterium RIFCSPLOWO2_01_FULL_42_67]O
MGQKINPIGFRIGSYINWKSRWFSEDNNYKDYLVEDILIRKVLSDRLKLAGLTEVEIERLPKSMTVTLSVSRPGVVIGRGGTGIEDVKGYIIEAMNSMRVKGKRVAKLTKMDIVVKEVKNPEISARLVAQRIVGELERRFPHRRVINKAMERVMAAGAKGVKVTLGGRIGGADISRVEKYHTGSVPTQTLRQNIDYFETPALLKKGYVGVKVWIHRGEEK